jgi:hypothetical protein
MKCKCKNLGGRYRGIPPLRNKRARMGHPSVKKPDRTITAVSGLP